jgi:Cysteine rich repeat
MKTAFYAGALGAALVIMASTASVQAEERDCAVDIKSLCAGIAPGGGHVLACLQSHVSELSVGCSSILSKAAWTAQECAADIQHFCPDAKVGTISDCMRPHLGEASDQCKRALAFIASPASDR